MALGLRARAERAVSGQCAAGRGAPSPYRGALVPPLGRDATHNKTRPTRSASAGNGLLETEARRGRRAGQTGAPWGLRGACGRAFRRAADGRRVLSAPRARRGRRGGRTAQSPSQPNLLNTFQPPTLLGRAEKPGHWKGGYWGGQIHTSRDYLCFRKRSRGPPLRRTTATG